MVGRLRQRVSGRGRPRTLGECPVCGEKVKRRQHPVKVWSGTYAHRACASFAHRSRRRRRLRSQPVHERFTTR